MRLIRFFSGYDFLLLFLVFFLIVWSVINIYSATINEYKTLYIKQAIYGFVGIVIIFLFPLINYRKFLNFSPFIYLSGVLMLVSVIFAGTTILGAKRWISLGFFTVQPSEFMKFVLIVTVAYILGQRKDGIDNRQLLIVTGVVSVPFLLTLKQPDLGTAITLLIPVLTMLFVGGLSKKIIYGSIIIGIILSPFIWEHLADYQKKRILAFINPEADPFKSAYHILQSKIAVGSGGLTGKGFLNGTQSKLFFLPEQHTDFIFATIGEEWGFVISFLILLVYLLIGLRILYWGIKVRDIEGKYICFGAGSLILTQAFINIAMTVGFAPVVGITLPFLSYGGSSMITFSLIVGLVLSVIRVYKTEKLSFS
ncbi:rod shape determining protein RodA [Persephonella hydrogeniphila]|uniref:Peptidoglycan glycosyltransferase RodA n=1 Tax=Persephonella hydrogeniphila TaxID=198703 RepID=A0A285NCB6_9AQUI|nr:rod shape-determining protein RodA [Persephonella hydrogeniphila]SNZ07142.1 rod shape determining protein RodA [Persephonella hydrogeniphila]